MRKVASIVAAAALGAGTSVGVAACGEDRGGVEVEGGTTGTTPTGTTPTGTAPTGTTPAGTAPTGTTPTGTGSSPQPEPAPTTP